MKTYAFIFARGGSKGLPGKNILPLNGIPLIGYSIEIAKEIGEISEIYVSTDDKGIAQVAKDLGAQVILRPNELATDTSPELDSWKHAISYLQNKESYFERFISLPPTAPLRNKDDVTKALAKFDESTDLVVTMTDAQRSPYFNMVKMNNSGYVETIIKNENKYIRRQDAPLCYDLTTVAYVSSPTYILSASNLFNGRVKAVNIPKDRSIDIDDKLDFDLAEMILKNKE
ncbi:acylneuraminate cytidylyltransferase family protein [Gammaproteobacteria bacterium]|nr:acylneuraminate cytidylyltransferase family protein [Gammaproteobacteria bacterium]